MHHQYVGLHEILEIEYQSRGKIINAGIANGYCPHIWTKNITQYKVKCLYCGKTSDHRNMMRSGWENINKILMTSGSNHP